jgi:hypothetical protein
MCKKGYISLKNELMILEEVGFFLFEKLRWWY